MQEEVHGNDKQHRINDARYEDPFPEFMLPDKPVCPDIALYGYDDFFEQWGLFSPLNIEELLFTSDDNITIQKLCSSAEKLDRSFYCRENVVQVARDLVGKLLVTGFNGVCTAARITETEAYNGVIDRASHAYGGRRTNRTGVMYKAGGTAYVYLCYGIHHLFNVVTNAAEVPHAVLVRAAEPLTGIPAMLARTARQKVAPPLATGPGNVSQALGITTSHTGLDLLGNQVFLLDDGFRPGSEAIIATPRIGVDYAGEDALLPYRFYLEGTPFVSGKRPLRPAAIRPVKPATT